MAIITVRNRAINLDAAEIPNLDASKITTGSFDASRIGSGTFADARIAASNVSQHATSFDDNKIVNDISTLGLRVHTQENLNASNSNSASFDVFQDASAISNLTNSFRDSGEFMSTISAETGLVFLMDGGENGSVDTNNFYNLASGSPVNRDGVSDNGNAGNAGIYTSQYKFGSKSYYYDNTSSTHDFRHYFNASSDWDFGTGDFSIDGFIRYSTATHEHSVMGVGDGSANGSYYIRVNEWNNDQLVFNVNNSSGNGHLNIASGAGGMAPNTWFHICVARKSGTMKVFIDGVSQTVTTSSNWATMPVGNSSEPLAFGTGMWAPTGMQGFIDGWRMYKGTAKYYDSNFTPPTTQPTSSVANATGSFTGNNITASSSTNKMGAVLTYQDNEGVNALNTDIVLQLSADGGSNYSTATLTPLPDFATGIKMAKVNDLSVTAGTSINYKLSFANQASGSKEARIRGVSLQY